MHITEHDNYNKYCLNVKTKKIILKVLIATQNEEN